MKTSSLLLAEQELQRLIIEMANFPEGQLEAIGKHFPPSIPGDLVQGVVPTFIQKLYAYSYEKEAEVNRANAMGNESVLRHTIIQHELLCGMICFFVQASLPRRLWGAHITGMVCRDFVLVFRPRVEDQNIPVCLDRKKLN